MRLQYAVILLAIVIGGALGASSVLLFTRDYAARPQLIKGQPLRYWVKALDAEDRRLRDEAATLIPQFGPTAIPSLIEALDRSRSQDPAAVALATIGAPALPAIRNSLTAPSLYLRLGAIKTIDLMGPVGGPAISQAAALLREDDAGPIVADLLIRAGPNFEVVGIAEDLVAHGTDSRQIDAIRVLAAASPTDPRVEASLLRAASNENRFVRAAAFKVLCNMATPPLAAADRFVDGLSDVETRFAAALALRKLGAAVVPSIAKLANHPIPDVRAEAASILSQLSLTDPAAANELFVFLTDTDPVVSGLANRTLAKMAAKDPTLVRQQLRSPIAKVRIWAIAQLKMMTPPPIDNLAPLLDDPERTVRDAMTSTMQFIYRDDDPSLLEANKSPYVTVRVRGVRLLPFSHSLSKYDVIIQSVDDPEVSVRLAAIGAMTRCLTSEHIVQRLIEVLAEDASFEVRAQCAIALSNLSHVPDVHSALVQATSDPSPTVANAARAALKEVALR